ncbi:flagellar export chaperone FliS [Acidithiobacillus sp.]|uniref:flagellar export chaperone FliS n=1 Tax=Acidithiobacillus sp. TaxID=1872118 RepID=UPI0025C1CE3E|nr:flagellar export chaperone FliS [Acidithiobacillus sp.]
MQQIPKKSAQDFSTAMPYFTADGLVFLGLEGVEKYIHRIRRALERRDFAAKQRAMERVQQVVQHLLVTLDDNLPSPHLRRLDSLYRYLLLKLAYINLFNDIQEIAGCATILGDLRLEWSAIFHPSERKDLRRLSQVDLARFLLG